jgi:hypothetical protein
VQQAEAQDDGYSYQEIAVSQVMAGEDEEKAQRYGNSEGVEPVQPQHTPVTGYRLAKAQAAARSCAAFLLWN